MSYKVAIIILHFGDKKDTMECLQSLNKIKQKRNIIIFVIDNGTNTLTNKDLHSILPQARLIKNEKNLGFAGGNNVGIKKALRENVDFILLLCNDTIVASPFLIEKLISPFNNPSIGIVGPILTYYGGSKKIYFAGGYLNKTFCFVRHLSINKTIDDALPKEGIVDFITGASMMVKRDVFEKIGFLDERYFVYWEDVDFCTRAQQIGYKCYFINNPLLRIRASESYKLSIVRAYYLARNPFLFMKKYKLNKSTSMIWQLFIKLPHSLLSIQNFTALKAYLKGLRDGLREII